MIVSDDEFFMKEAIAEAKKAKEIGEVPVGAVIVQNGKIISRGYNKRETERNALCHAEIEAINNACKYLNGWRLPECTLYVTLEPCTMCAGAIVNARIDRVVYGCRDQKSGAVESVCKINDFGLNYTFDYTHGVLEGECSSLLSEFFSELRIKKQIKQ